MNKPMTLSLAAATIALLATGFASRVFAQAPPTEAQIADILKTANDGEIDAAKKAKSSAVNPQVKEFATHMIEEHSSNNKDAKKLEKKIKLKPESNDVSASVKADAKTKMADLKKLKGAEFDKTYIDQQVAMHKQVLSDLTDKFIPAATNPDFKAFLEATKSHVEEHLKMAQAIQTELNK